MDAESTIARPPDSLEDLLRRIDFPAVDYPAWKRRVEEELGDTPFAEALVTSLPEGIEIEPLYSAASSPSTADADFYLGRQVCLAPLVGAEYSIRDPVEAAAAIAAGWRQGVVSPWLRVGYVGGALAAPGSPGTIRISDIDELRILLQGIPLSAQTVVEVVGDLLPLERAVDDCGDFLSDPIGEAFPSGDVNEPLDRALADLVAFTSREARHHRLLVSACPHHEAGASAVDELALALATGVELLRRLSTAGLAPGEAETLLTFRFSVGEDLFVEVAKLRAARLLWSKVLSAAGVEKNWTWIHARGSRRGLSATDLRTNLLRGAVQCFAASVGGADAFCLTPYDEPAGEPTAHARRLAAMTQHVLEREARLDRFADPAGGSWLLGSLTDRLARAAWQLFRELESGGGILPALRDGRVHEIVHRSAERRDADHDPEGRR